MRKIYTRYAAILLAILVLFLLPREIEVGSANDCYWTYQPDGTPICTPYSQPQVPAHTTQSAMLPSQGTAGRFFQYAPLTRTSSECLFATTISWVTQGVSDVQVTVNDPDNGHEKVFSGDTSGSAPAPWIQPNKAYLFQLWDVTGGAKNKLDQQWVSGHGLSCAAPTSVPAYPVQTPPTYINQNQPNYYPQGIITISSNQAYCVGQTPTYSASVPWAPNQTGTWTTHKNGQQVNQTTFTLDSSGLVSGTGNQWIREDIGRWRKSMVVGGVTQSIEFDVRDCGHTPTTNQNYYTDPMYHHNTAVSYPIQTHRYTTVPYDSSTWQTTGYHCHHH